jgi:hypothetical protein
VNYRSVNLQYGAARQYLKELDAESRSQKKNCGKPQPLEGRRLGDTAGIAAY